MTNVVPQLLRVDSAPSGHLGVGGPSFKPAGPRVRTVQAQPGLQAQRVARAQAAQPHARALQQLLRQLHRALRRHRDLKPVLTRVPGRVYGVVIQPVPARVFGRQGRGLVVNYQSLLKDWQRIVQSSLAIWWTPSTCVSGWLSYKPCNLSTDNALSRTP